MSKTLRYYHIDQECDWDGPRLDEVVLHVPPALLDAHVYRSCPECGGSELVAARVNPNLHPEPDEILQSPCPACADAPVAIVDTALREKAAAKLYHHWPRDQSYETLSEPLKDSWRESVDFTLSTVLGHVRYAKEIVEVCLPGRGVPVSTRVVGCTVPSAGWSALYDGDPIAILEEAGKEE